MAEVDCMACVANHLAGCPTTGARVEIVLGVTHWMVPGTHGVPALPVRAFKWYPVARRWMNDLHGAWLRPEAPTSRR